MDALRPGHAHRSSSDRLLNNYLDSQKHLSTSLLTLLSHSHSSTSSLLAYVTSSPGVVQAVRRSVRHAAFEGPLSPSLIDNPETGSHTGPLDETQGWSAYIACLDQFRKDLKQIHLLEEELSRVKRDREILVSRLIKTTKSRPTKSDLTAIATQYRSDVQSSGASLSSWTSNGSSTTKEGKRAGKLADAQAELLGCEEHLRGLEVRIEHERNTVMLRGLEDRFRAMDAVARMWLSQAKRGLEDLEKINELPADAYELDSNPSLAPSQSASQVAYDDDRSPIRGHVPYPKLGAPINGPGSITGSIVEEDEGSSGDEGQGNLVLHENRPGSRATMTRAKTPTPAHPSPLGVASVTSRARPISTTYGASHLRNGGSDYGSDVPNSRAGGRRAASDIGAMGYRPPTGRQPLRRTFSADRNNRDRAGSDTSSIRAKKKKGFFSSISRFFKGPKKREGSRSGRESPPYGSSSGKGGWHTRTDSNIKRSSSMYGASRAGRRGGDDSSSDDEGGNFVSVSNNRDQGTWSVDQAGRAPSRNSMKRSSTLPVASGLIPQKPAAITRNSSQSTITGRTTPAPSRSAAATPTPGAKPSANGSLSRSGTVKSVASVASGKTNNTVKSAGTAKTGATNGTVKKKTRANGAIARSASVHSQQPAVEGRNIMSLVDKDLKASPVMPEVPKAPKSGVNPQMELPKAPGSSIVPPEPVVSRKMDDTSPIEKPKTAISRSGSVKKAKQDESPPPRSTTPLPPSRTLQPPLKSALRPSSPVPPTPPTLGPTLGQVINTSPPKPLYTISAPGPVELPKEEPKPIPIPAPVAKPTPPTNTKRNSYHSMTSDGNSIYESAVEDEGAPGGDGGEESSDSDDEPTTGYHFVENERVKRLGINVGPPKIERIPSEQRHQDHDEYEDDGEGSNTSVDTATHPTSAAQQPSTIPFDARSDVSRRKSVRMAVPDSPAIETAHAPGPITDPKETTSYTSPAADRAPSPPPNRERTENWSTRIGRMRDDTSEESDHDDDYLAARKGLLRNSGKWEAVEEDGKKKIKRKSASTAGSVKKGNSIKRSSSRA